MHFERSAGEETCWKKSGPRDGPTTSCRAERPENGEFNLDGELSFNMHKEGTTKQNHKQKHLEIVKIPQENP